MRTGANWARLAGLAVLITACAEDRGMDAESCPPRDSVTVVNRAGELIANPECVEVVAGNTLTLNLQPGRPSGSARTRPQSGGPPWLDQENVAENEIVIEVPSDACSSDPCIYKYEVEIDGIGMLDPRVRVTN